MSDATHCLVLTTTDTEAAADRLARTIIEVRAGACAQVVGPVRSTYRWQGAIHLDQEWQVWVKTTTTALDSLIDYIKAHHPYDLPEVLAVPVIAGSPEYLRWVSDETLER